LGVLEMLGGILMLLRRTRLIGCLLVTSILVNVILQDIFYGVNVGALKAAIIYQLLIFAILWLNKAKVIQCFKILTAVEVTALPGKILITRIVLSVLLFALLRVLEYFITIPW